MSAERSEPAAGAVATVLIRHRLVARFSDCDPLGHVNNASYLTYLEQARLDLWRRQAGLELRDAVASGGRRGESFILARAEIDFRSPVLDGEVLEVRMTLEGFGRTSATYAYEIVEVTKGRLVASARTVVVWYDYEAARPAPLSAERKLMLSKPLADVG